EEEIDPDNSRVGASNMTASRERSKTPLAKLVAAQVARHCTYLERLRLRCSTRFPSIELAGSIWQREVPLPWRQPSPTTAILIKFRHCCLRWRPPALSPRRRAPLDRARPGLPPR